ncbi:glycosyltransferase family 2 protein [Fibrobacterota bacterium]
MPEVSVIMNCYNSATYLRQAIDSVYAQTFKDWEIIFWDNVSTDSSPEIAKSYGEKLRYFRGEENVPLYAARNLAIRKAEGKFITVLDCDDFWYPEKLELQVQVFKEHTDAVFAYSNVHVLESSGKKRVLHSRLQPHGTVFGQLVRDYRVNLQSVMIARSAMDGLDYYFDDSMQYAGDMDLLLRLAFEGKVLYNPEITTCYREHSGSLSADRIELLAGENNKIINRFAAKYPDFNDRYAREIVKYRNKTLLSIVVAKWKYSGGRSIRQYLKNQRPITAWSILLFAFSFIPYRVAAFIKYRIA